jgi:prepilin-type N-terminal cleavage/methylation domain-containing protein
MAIRGYTLVEMVAVMTILGIVGMVSSYVIFESMKVYARTVPALDASYQARLAVERMKSDFRDMKAGSITTYTSTALTFQLSAGQTIAYSLSGSNLLRNGDLLAKGVSAFTFGYRKEDGTSATAAVDLHLLELDLTVQTAGQPYRVQTAVFPRNLGT